MYGSIGLGKEDGKSFVVSPKLLEEQASIGEVENRWKTAPSMQALEPEKSLCARRWVAHSAWGKGWSWS